MNLLEMNNIDTLKKEEEKLYLQINRIKLQDYIARGMIVPDMYLGDEAERDIQSKNKSYLAFSNSYIKQIDESQLLLEIIFTDEEQLDFKKSGDIYFYDKPLPITRIKQIYIQDKKTRDELLRKISNYQIGYIPERLFVFFKKGKKNIFDKCFEYQILESNEIVNHKEKIRKFDKMMGMLSFMKNRDLYYFKKMQIFSNYSQNYIPILSLLNDSLNKEETEFLNELKENREFFDLLNSDTPMNDDFINSIIQTTTDEEIKEIFITLLNDPTGKRRCLEALRDKSGVYFYICLLYIHKQKDSNKKDSFKANIAQDIPYKRSELALAFLGLYYGYSSLRADEEIHIDDKYISKLIEKNRVNMKFKLDSKLDYITIETVYKYAFYDKKRGEEFGYLEYPGVKKLPSLPNDKKFKSCYEIEQKKVFDTQYLKVRKKSFEELAAKSLSNYKEEEINFGCYYLASFVAINFEYLLFYSKDGKPVAPYFEKSNFLEIIKDEKNNTIQNKLLKVFELDNK